MTATIHVGDCLETMRGLPDASVDAIVTDPPYGISFMGKGWDSDVPPVAVWAECLRVLKPGGHLLAFAGTRTQHRMATRIEDAGFEIRDLIAWVYGSGFPKSLDVSKAIDKAAGAEREVIGQSAHKPGIANGTKGHTTVGGTFAAHVDITAPATEAARQWQGWGTALKPALEPITVARKPLAGTVAANVLEHGTGGLNIDGCRVGTGGATTRSAQTDYAESGWRTGHKVMPVDAGRWPANLIHDGSDEVLAEFPADAGGGDSRGACDGRRPGGFGNVGAPSGEAEPNGSVYADQGSAARFFYCAKPSTAERGHGNNHATVKPVDLMRYLVRLVTPKGGTVLDPFTGSGTTGIACVAEGFNFIGCELSQDYADIARRRISDEAPLFVRATTK